MEYQIRKKYSPNLSSAISSLIEDVNEQIEEGWVPVGSVSTVMDNYNWHHASQAMTHE